MGEGWLYTHLFQLSTSPSKLEQSQIKENTYVMIIVRVSS